MINRLLILLTTYLVISCNSQADKKIENQPVVKIPKKIEKISQTERFIPLEKTVKKFDTILSEHQIQISITKKDLDSYVINQYEIDGKKQIDKYRDAIILLKIRKKSEVILDTIFRKEQFENHCGRQFKNIAIFHNYWFESIDENQIQFFGVISQPETDNSLSFYHYFNLKNKTFKFVKMVDEE
ncbi:uncharacterized protein DUF4738 [Flavobacterium sp. 270]|uniref:DUF4738 domain-containing protein n=1 Tax=Flavobacterium sp. 270 TaxID=2512114 RepID=UPI001066134B|nr:DUF4738 domain-containing protein [Flavobacterium sp. 270]TDW51436.1 uncharacterized protein DUF4738 [Flavobacterium sp. 270]